jgi:hypothetical protein
VSTPSDRHRNYARAVRDTFRQAESDVPAWVDEHMPYRGPCAFCDGPDARHRMLDSIADQARTEGAEGVAADFGYPLAFVERVAAEWVDE